MVISGLTHGDRALILRRHQYIVLLISVIFNLCAAALDLNASWHLLNIFSGAAVAFPAFAMDEKLMLRGAWNMQGVSWRDYLVRGSHEFYFDTQSPFWGWIVCQSPTYARVVTTILTAITFEMLAQHLLTFSFLLAATPLIVLLRSSIQYDIVAFDLVLIGVLTGGAWGGLLIGAGCVTKYYFIPSLFVTVWSGDIQAAGVAVVIIMAYFVWLRGTHFFYVQRRFLRKSFCGRYRKSMSTPARHLTFSGTSRRALIFLAYLFPLLTVSNGFFLVGFAAALYILAPPKYLLLLGLTILC